MSLAVPARVARHAAALVVALAAVPALAQDAARGRALYELHCLECHYERIHRREPARSLVRTRAQLRHEVARRAEAMPRRFSPAEIEDLVEYLDRSHYRLPR